MTMPPSDLLVREFKREFRASLRWRSAHVASFRAAGERFTLVHGGLFDWSKFASHLRVRLFFIYQDRFWVVLRTSTGRVKKVVGHGRTRAQAVDETARHISSWRRMEDELGWRVL